MYFNSSNNNNNNDDDINNESLIVRNELIDNLNFDNYLKQIKKGELPFSNNVIERCLDWHRMNITLNANKTTHNAFTFFPFSFDYKLYEEIFKLQININKLMHKLATSPQILEKVLEK
jgi:hypothetical protein